MDLAAFLFNYGINTTTYFDLKDIANELKIKVKILMKDELKEFSAKQDELKDPAELALRSKEYKKHITNAIINFQKS